MKTQGKVWGKTLEIFKNSNFELGLIQQDLKEKYLQIFLVNLWL